jgi:hypothetical protein
VTITGNNRSFWGVIAADKFGRNIERNPVTVSYDHSARLQILAPLSSTTSDFEFPAPALDDERRNFPCPPGRKVQGSNGFCRVGDGDPNVFGKLGEFCGTYCSDCPAGSYSSVVGSLECILCPINHYSPAGGATMCTPCPAGSSTRGQVGSKTCSPCAYGWYNDLAGGDCRKCPAGTFSNVNREATWGPTQCVDCVSLFGAFFQPVAGQGMCQECPENTEKKFGARGTDISECICKEGFWRPDGLPGATCIMCPDGATCKGGPQQQSFPVSKDNYWAKHVHGIRHPSMFHSRRQQDDDFNAKVTEVKVLAGYPFPAASDNHYEADFELPQIFFECLDGSCLANNTCVESNTGVMCAGCADGFFNFFGACLRCPGGRGSRDSILVTVFAWAVVVFLWNALEILAQKYQTVGTLMLFMQCLSIVQDFSVPWPKDLRGVIAFFAIADFDIDVVSPQCFIHWDYYSATGFTLALPVIFLSISVLHVLLAYVWSKTVARRQIWGLRLPFMHAEIDRVYDFAIQRLASWLSILVILYNELCKKSFQTFMCETLPDGKSFLIADPDIECNTVRHHIMIGFSVFALIVYVVGIPAFFAWSLLRYT